LCVKNKARAVAVIGPRSCRSPAIRAGVHFQTPNRPAIPQRMSKSQPNTNSIINNGKRAQPPRMRAALRKAVDAIVLKGVTQRAAAELVGMNESALGRALQRPAIAAHVENLKAQACIDADKLKQRAKAIAIAEGIRLMLESGSDAVRARMVEFFAGEGQRGTQVQVNVDARSGGYEFPRPGQKVVEIEGKATPPDS